MITEEILNFLNNIVMLSILDIHQTDLGKKYIKAVISGQTYPSKLKDQIILVYSYQGMKASVLMNTYLEQAPIVLCINNVFNEAVRFRQAYNDLLESQGTDFPYLRILGAGMELNHSSYPDLYFCAITYYKGAGTLGDKGNFVRSTIQTVTPQDT